MRAHRETCVASDGPSTRAAHWGQHLPGAPLQQGGRLKQKGKVLRDSKVRGVPAHPLRYFVLSVCQMQSTLGWALLLCLGVELQQLRAEDVSPLCHPLVKNVPTSP